MPKSLLVQELIDPKQTQQPVPVFVGGQSMGGLVAALVAIRDQTIWQVQSQMHASACMGLLRFESQHAPRSLSRSSCTSDQQ